MFVFGASGHGKVIIDMLETLGIVHGVFDDDPHCIEVLGYLVGRLPEYPDSEHPFFIAIGNNQIRKEIFARLMGKVRFGTLVHSTAIVSKRTTIDPGTVVMEGAIIKVDSRIGSQVIINTNASVDHDCTLGDFVHLAPQATLCGGVTVGEGTMVGANATVIPYVKVGAWCKIGAGSVVNKDVPDGATWIGSGMKESREQQE